MIALNDLSHKIIGCAMKIHRQLGPGLLENVYHQCLLYELLQSDIPVQSEVIIPIKYESLFIESGLKADLIIDNRIIVELKSVESINENHKAQTLTYLKMSRMELGLLINFKESILKNGIHRFINSNNAINSVNSAGTQGSLRDAI